MTSSISSYMCGVLIGRMRLLYKKTIFPYWKKLYRERKKKVFAWTFYNIKFKKDKTQNLKINYFSKSWQHEKKNSQNYICKSFHHVVSNRLNDCTKGKWNKNHHTLFSVGWHKISSLKKVKQSNLSLWVEKDSFHINIKTSFWLHPVT